MNNRSLLNWLYANIDELIDFDGYGEPLEENSNEREQFIKTCFDNGRSVCDDSG